LNKRICDITREISNLLILASKVASESHYIGSGMIEAGNKVVIQKRMKQAGMRWGLENGQYMAALRAKHESKMWRDVEDIIYDDNAA